MEDVKVIKADGKTYHLPQSEFERFSKMLMDSNQLIEKQYGKQAANIMALSFSAQVIEILERDFSGFIMR